MKKILFLVAFFSIATMASMNAQTKTAPVLTAAIEAAKNNPDIIQKVGSDGNITFKQKSVCSESGRVSYKPVSYNAETKSWTAASSKGHGSAKSCGGKSTKSAKSCCSGKKSCGGKSAKSCGSKSGHKKAGAKS